MITLTDKEIEYAINIQDLIEKRGFSNLAKTEIDAGFVSQNSMYKVFQYLKEDGWEYADQLIASDATLLAELEKTFDEPIKKRQKTKIDANLNRRLRNLFTRDDFKRLNIKEMNYQQALELVEKRERELLENDKRYY